MEPVFYRIREAAQLCGLSENAMYRWVRKGVIPSKRLGKHIRIPVKAFNDWAEQCDKVEATAKRRPVVNIRGKGVA